MPADRVAAFREAVEEALLLEDRRLRRIEVFRLGVSGERPAAESDRPAAFVAHDEDQAVAEAIVGSGFPLRPGRQEPGFEEQALRVGGDERAGERVPGVGRIAETEASGHFRGNAAVLEIPGSLVAGLADLRHEESVRRRHRFEDLLLAVLLRTAKSAAGNRDTEAGRQRFDGFREIEPVHLTNEVDDVAARSAAEAVEEPLLPVHREGGGSLVVKRAQSLP